MKITYLGHSCLLIETRDKTIITDPFITGNELAKSIDINRIKADYILITHAHQDHILDVETIAIPILKSLIILLRKVAKDTL